MMIFDRFPSLTNAEAFAAAAQKQTELPSVICHNQEQFEKHDIFPLALDYPVVLVPRLDDIEAEAEVELLVVEFDGEFAGT